jgi:Tfp pilus assembly protein PilW
MDTQSKVNSVADSAGAAAERVTALNEKAVANSQKVSNAYASTYEKTVVQWADRYEKAAGATKIEWLASVGSLQADVTRQLARAYAGAVREFVA